MLLFTDCIKAKIFRILRMQFKDPNVKEAGATKLGWVKAFNFMTLGNGNE
jgi:hypothetical protein